MPGSHSRRATLAQPAVVSLADQISPRPTADTPRQQTNSNTTARTDPSSLPSRPTPTVGLLGLQYHLASRGFSQAATATMLQARRQVTYQQYATYLGPWFQHCATHMIDPHRPTVPQAINFMATLTNDRQLGYNATNTMRSALSSVILSTDGVSFGQRAEVKLYMRGAYHAKPPTPRYVDVWDPQTVLDLLRLWAPAQKLSLKQLTLKVVVLSLLVSGQRLQTIDLLDLNYMKVSTSSYTFVLPKLLKQSRPGYNNPKVSLKAYAPDRRICIFTYLSEYLQRTKPIRQGTTALFLTLMKPYHKASKATLARWVKEVLTASGIDTTVYGPHSARAASSSAAKKGGASMQTVLDTAGWTTTSTFARYYLKPLNRRDYSEAVLDSK